MNKQEVPGSITASICAHGRVTTLEFVCGCSQRKYCFSPIVLICVSCQK
jgi:hypothetical protein